MAKRFIIDEIRANRWMVRMRDRETDEVVEVPIELGALWPGKLRGDAVPRESREEQTAATSPSEVPPVSDEVAVEPPAAEPPAAEPPAEKKPRKRGMARVTDPEPLKEIMSTPLLRSQDVDESTIEPDDMVALRKMQALMRRAKGRRDAKVGELGWEETTDAGRSGLASRFGDGMYKILHAGGDTYALFFEWDDGRYENLGCGTAEGMMTLANFKAKEEPPEPPPSHLSLELARFTCGTPAQKSSANERLEPAFAEVRQDKPRATGGPRPTDARQQAVEREFARVKGRKDSKRQTEPESVMPNAEMDQKLSDSLKRALAELDAQDTAGGEGE